MLSLVFTFIKACFPNACKKIEQEKMSIIEVLSTVNSIKRILEEKKTQASFLLRLKRYLKKTTRKLMKL